MTGTLPPPVIDDKHFIFTLYGSLYHFYFARNEETRGYEALVKTTPVGNRFIGSMNSARPRIEMSVAITRQMEASGKPVALRVLFPPHGLYYYKPHEGPENSPGVPARIVGYHHMQVRLIVASGAGIDWIDNVDPLTDIARRDTDETFGWTAHDIDYLYGKFGGSSCLRELALFSDPLGFMFFGL